MKRGDVVTVIAPGEYGKARPAVVVQSDQLIGTSSVIVCPITTFERNAPVFRLPIAARPENGLKYESQIMIDKIAALSRSRIKSQIGVVDQTTMETLGRLLASCLGINAEPHEPALPE